MGFLKFFGYVSDPLSWVFIVPILLIIIYVAVITHFNFWKRRGVKTSKILPIVGDSLFSMVYGKIPYSKLTKGIYDEARELRYIGYFELQKPKLMLKSPELIKQLFVKDADSFVDRPILFPDDCDEIMSKTLIFLKGQEWKDVRGIWNTFFTASQVEKIYPLLIESGKSFVQRFADREDEIIEFEIKQTANVYIASSSASTYFGIETDASKTQIRELLSKLGDIFIFGNGILHDFKYCLHAYAPYISGLFGMRSLIREDVTQHFKRTIGSAIRRENNNVHRPDLIGLYFEKQKEEDNESFAENLKKKKSYLSDEEIVSQLCMFLLNSLDGSVTTLNFALYELAMNPDVQKKVIEEIDDVNTDENSPSYNTIVGLNYLDMVISETMRKWPAAIILDRKCTKPYTIEAKSPEEVPIHLNIGDTIVAPLYALHHDPNHFPNPEKFDPERFSPENRANVKPYTYLPWGVGPRNCNGGKIALASIKIILFQLLTHYELVVTSKTPTSIKLKKKVNRLEAEEDVFVGVKRRKIS